jgi:hypothetical protein
MAINSRMDSVPNVAILGVVLDNFVCPNVRRHVHAIIIIITMGNS